MDLPQRFARSKNAPQTRQSYGTSERSLRYHDELAALCLWTRIARTSAKHEPLDRFPVLLPMLRHELLKGCVLSMTTEPGSDTADSGIS